MEISSLGRVFSFVQVAQMLIIATNRKNKFQVPSNSQFVLKFAIVRLDRIFVTSEYIKK